jgi:hypothetical protein
MPPVLAAVLLLVLDVVELLDGVELDDDAVELFLLLPHAARATASRHAATAASATLVLMFSPSRFPGLSGLGTDPNRGEARWDLAVLPVTV